MASNKKNPAAAVSPQTSLPAAPAAVPAKATSRRAKSAPLAAASAKGAATRAADPKPVAAKKSVVARPAKKPVDPAVQASKEALAKALAAAQAVKITKPLGKPAKVEKVEKTDKAPKTKKTKLVRDSFTMPEAEYAQIAALKKRLLDKGMVSKKSEVLRAGVALLMGLSDGELVAAMRKVEVIKTGRPAKSGK